MSISGNNAHSCKKNFLTNKEYCLSVLLRVTYKVVYSCAPQSKKIKLLVSAWTAQIHVHFAFELLLSQRLSLKSNRSDEGLTLETSAFLPFTVANLRFQPSC